MHLPRHPFSLSLSLFLICFIYFSFFFVSEMDRMIDAIGPHMILGQMAQFETKRNGGANIKNIRCD